MKLRLNVTHKDDSTGNNNTSCPCPGQTWTEGNFFLSLKMRGKKSEDE